VKGCVFLTRVFSPKNQIARYAPLGLLANPFFGSGASDDGPDGCELTSESNRLLSAILVAVEEEKPRPIWVSKETDLPASYTLATEARVEYTLASDSELDLLHAYIPLFGMRNGAVRAALSMIAERLIHRDFDKTLALYLERVLAAPDETLTSYQVMGPEALAEFAEAFEADPLAAVEVLFGGEVIERQPELSEVADFRQVMFSGDEEVVPDDAVEIDDTIGDAPGIAGTLGVDDEGAEVGPELYAGVLDYIIDHTREHLSPVIARALRVYRGRGLAATTAEINVTKAPKKTLAALVEFASVRYRKIVIMYDGFENWLDIEQELRSKIVGLLSELRWMLDGQAVFVFMVAPGTAPELEESFGGSTVMTWDFPGIDEIYEDPEVIPAAVVDRWLANAAAPGAAPMSLADEGMAAVLEAAGGSMQQLIFLGREAIESAADRGVSSIDAQAVSDAVAAVVADEAGA